ncbi:MAG: helix-turn-helix domain-containing protein [Acidobacteriota bacterium]|nr:helix-turn-helix domain-containing protein [Acidobacteriota bacterium]
MDNKKRKALEAAGWRVGSASDFLGLTPEEERYIETKLLLSKRLKKEREKKQLSQTALAKLLHSSQSRIAKMEANDPGVTVDLLVKALFATGLTTKDLGRLLAKAS